MTIRKILNIILALTIGISLVGCGFGGVGGGNILPPPCEYDLQTTQGGGAGGDFAEVVPTESQPEEKYNWQTDDTLQRNRDAFLGAVYTETATTFRIWSPDTPNVRVVIDPDGTPARHTMPPAEVWAAQHGYTATNQIYGVTVQGDLWLAEYIFELSRDGGTSWVAAPDPYAMMARPGAHHTLEGTLQYNRVSRSIVIDPGLIVPTGGWVERPALISRTDAVIYEMHVRDFTFSATSGVSPARRGKYMGLVESGTTVSRNGVTVSTGLDHLVELGVTHVHLMPVFDFMSPDFNWGYEPWNYNVPEDSFSMTPHDFVNRIYEFKTMVNEFHRAGIRVIMDKVFNHSAMIGSGENRRGIFNGISSQWYLEQDATLPQGVYSITGVGNTINNENPMVARFFRDSLEYWVTEFNISGFRFDLLGAVPMRTYEQWALHFNARQAGTSTYYGNAHGISRFRDRNLIFYGEPWASDSGRLGNSSNGNDQYVRQGFMPALSPHAHAGVFNATAVRRPIRGSLNNNEYLGVMHSQTGLAGYGDTLGNAFRGSFTAGARTTPLDNPFDGWFTNSAEQSINYIFAHDNLNAYDRFSLIPELNWAGAAHRTTTLGYSMMMFMQGIPFVFSGDEFLRTKRYGGDGGRDIAHNTYKFPDRYNSIDWRLKIDNLETNNVFRDMIHLRRMQPLFRMNSRQHIITENRVSVFHCTTNRLYRIHIRNPNPGDGWNEAVVVAAYYNDAGVVGTTVDLQLGGTGSWNFAFSSTSGISTSLVSFDRVNADNSRTPTLEPFAGARYNITSRNVLIFYR